MTTLPTSPVNSMDWAMKTLAELCERVDEGEELNDAFLQTFAEAKNQLAYNADRAIAFDEFLTGLIAQAKLAKTEWGKREKMLKNAQDTFKKYTHKLLLESPDVPTKGSLGTIKIAKNPPKISYDFPIESKSVSNILSDEVISMFNIPDRFVEERVYKTLNRDEVKAALAGKEELGFAKTIQETRLAIKRV